MSKSAEEQRAEYAQALQQALMSKDMTQANLAAKLHLSRQAVNGYTQGVRTPDPIMSQLIEEAVGVRLGHLLGYRSHFDDDPTPPGGAAVEMGAAAVDGKKVTAEELEAATALIRMMRSRQA